jgi:hypothetical protein
MVCKLALLVIENLVKEMNRQHLSILISFPHLKKALKPRIPLSVKMQTANCSIQRAKYGKSEYDFLHRA